MSERLCKVIIPGGSGFLGRKLAAFWAEKGWEVVVLSRQERSGSGRIRQVAWDGVSLGAWASEFEGAEAVVNMAGRSVNCRYNSASRREIYQSRLQSTCVIGEAISAADAPPRVWINAGSATVYRHAEDRPMDEQTGEIGTGFSVDVCRKWEQALFEAPIRDVRRVALRTALVLGTGKGGVMDYFVPLARWGLGGTLGNGRQYVSWVHELDFLRAIEWLVVHEELDGPVNCTAPNPLPNREFMRCVREACGRSFGLAAPAWLLEIAAFFLRTETELLLKSRRVVPRRLLQAGFQFQFPDLQPALDDLLRP